jgi:hypothetical protein
MSANFEMMVFKIDGDNADFVNGFANKSELINYLLKNAKIEYEKSKIFFENGMSTVAASKLEADAMRKGIEWIIDNVLTEDQVYSMYNHLMKYAYHFGEDRGDSYDRILKGQPSKNPLVQEYLDNCEFVGVSSPSRGGSPDNPEKAKEEALLLFQSKVNDYAQKIGKKPFIDSAKELLGFYKGVKKEIDDIK